ncbi:carboxylate-amine ligase [Legionella steigerwaltii]|uniref:Carboxylate-amine ligase n=1 Tax=Legionella steigerwaltii TaxID=460 RepID=A0A378L6Z8_9GAMM|nr:glutamate-cysteine ligase family protein [Legionella steigerwaltii]KTD77037.1 Carboxylate-amine ligase YbdK [Legionella steigerwaltii]STY22477.1 carboxylate-amine ligase [Legionella steigerwaltii]
MAAHQLSIGLELEANVIDIDSGKAIIDFNNGAFQKLSSYLNSQGYPPLQTEFDAATIELSTLPCHDVDLAFKNLSANLHAANNFLYQQGHLLLLLGLHPGRGRDELIMTDSPYCLASLPLMAEQGGPLFYCSFQINLGVDVRDIDYLIPLCHWLQVYMWPCSVITQSSPVFANRNTNYKSFRVRLNDALSGSRTGPLPLDICNLSEFKSYCSNLPDEANTLRKYNVWYDIFPKLIDEKNPSAGYRIEIRLADTTELAKLYVFTQAMVLTFMSILHKLKAKEPLIVPEHRWFMLNRDSVLKKGSEARITHSGEEFYSISDYLNTIWRPLVANYARDFNVDINNLILQLTGKSRASDMLKQFQTMTADQIALNYAHSDYQKVGDGPGRTPTESIQIV